MNFIIHGAGGELASWQNPSIKKTDSERNPARPKGEKIEKPGVQMRRWESVMMMRMRKGGSPKFLSVVDRDESVLCQGTWACVCAQPHVLRF